MRFFGNLIWQLFFTVVIIIMFISSIKVIYLNLKYFNILKEGVITERMQQSDQSLPEVETADIVFNYTIKTSDSLIVKASSSRLMEQGDQVKFRVLGESGIIFEHNNYSFTSRWSVWDYLAPIFCILILLVAFIYFKKKFK